MLEKKKKKEKRRIKGRKKKVPLTVHSVGGCWLRHRNQPFEPFKLSPFLFYSMLLRNLKFFDYYLFVGEFFFLFFFRGTRGNRNVNYFELSLFYLFIINCCCVFLNFRKFLRDN